MVDEAALQQAVRAAATVYMGREVLALDRARDLAARFGVVLGAVYGGALAAGVVPLRYARNLGTIGIEGQQALLRSCVAVIGLGGLGGSVVEGLARMGVGKIVAIDGDVFEEHNLNRQVLSSEAALGTAKVDAAAARVAAVNGAVAVETHRVRVTRANAEELLGGADVIVDALDNLPDRLLLQETAAALGRPLVHGAIAGFVGQVMVVLPGDRGLRALYPGSAVPEKGVETVTGTPAATPMLVAALQVQETVKLLTGVGTPLRHCLFLVDTECGDFQRLELGS
ncbi:MAG: HesA/MoeB/ThiF family protein [Anaerolineae bacterium]